MLLLAGCNEPPRDAFFTLSSLPQEPATQAPFRISETTGAPVLTRGPAGAWDSVDVLNPSVIRFKGKLLNFYSGFDGESWRTGLATSDDGMHWAKFGGNPVLSPGHSWDSQYIAANGAAIAWKGRILYLYQGQDAQGITRIGLATTSDGERLAKANRPVLDVGRPHAWDGKAVGDPYVIVRGSKLYLYYLGMDEHNIQRLGVAMSSDGERWTKFAGNPILDVGAASTFDENGLGEPSVVFSAPFYYMIYTGRSASESRDLGYAISSDGVSWKKMSTAGVFTDRKGWNDKVICDSTILGNDDGSFTVWYGGGDVARPDERIDGQIGRFSLTLAPPYVADGFDASVDYLAAGLRSTSILRGSWVADGGSAWVGPDASARIWSLPGDGQSIDISGWMPVSLYRKAGIDAPISLRATINGKQVAEKSFTSDELFHIRVLPKQLQGMTAPLFVELQTDHSFTPSTFSSSPDTRALSLKVSRVGLSR
ncbi:hypothetical protein [Rhodanobacter fulvus]|nr:hypothetical protein [Rhodanobacter fulvus]